MRVSHEKPLPEDKTFDPYQDQRHTRNRKDDSKSNDSLGFHKRDREETSEDPKRKMSKSFFVESRASINKFGKPPKTVVNRKNINKKKSHLLAPNESQSKTDFNTLE